MLNIKTISPVNVRSGPGMGFDVVKQFPTGHVLLSKEVKTDGGGNQWYKVNGGWLSANYAVEVQEQMKPTSGARGTSFLAGEEASASNTNAKPTENARTYRATPISDSVLAGQSIGIVSNPNGGIFAPSITGQNPQEKNTADNLLKKRIFGTPYQFMSTTDCRPVTLNSAQSVTGVDLNGDAELGAHFMQMMAEAPILSIIPGKPNFLPDVDDESKAAIINAFEDAANGMRDVESSKFLDKFKDKNAPKKEDMRYFEFLSDHSTYIRYVNTLCRMNAIMMGIGEEYVPGYENSGQEVFKFKNYDWSSFRLANHMAGRALSYSDQNLAPTYNLLQTAQSFGDYVKKNYNKGDGIFSGIGNIISAFNLEEYFIDFYINPSIGYSESFNNSTKESMVASAFNSMGDITKELAFLLGAGAVKDSGNIMKAGAKLTEEIGGAADTLLGGETFIKKLTGNAAAIISGSNLFFPELWTASDYSRSYSVEIDLKTPYGNRKNIFMDLFVPMWHWIALVAPRQTTVNSYGAPFICRAYIPGMFSSEMSIVESLTIQKGGDGSAWSVDGYPLEIKLQVNIKDLYNGFSIAKINNFDEAYNFIWNHALIDYVSVQSGLNMKLTEYSKKLEVAMALAGTAMRDLYKYPMDVLKESLSRNSRLTIDKALSPG